MQRLKSPSIFLFCVCLFSVWPAAVSALGQSAKTYGPTPPATEKQVVEKPRPEPFAMSGASGRREAIEYRTVEQMTARDRGVAANAESSIAEHTKYANLEFNEGSWSYQQVVCPALPQHVFLRFLRNNGVGDVSVFTASVPREGEGQVRIIPIQLRGYSLFSPAPINAMTVAAFNKIRAEENPDHAPVADWLGVGMCYAALAGGHPVLPPVEDEAMPKKLIAEDKGILEAGDGGGLTISFNDVSAPGRTMEWTLAFDHNGKLVKAWHSAAQPIQVIAVKPEMVDVNPKAAAVAQPEVRAISAQPSPAASAMHPVPPPQAVVMKTVPGPAAN